MTRFYRRNADTELNILENQYLLDPTLENRITLINASVRAGRTDRLDKIFENYEKPLLDIFRQINSNNLSIYAINDGILERFSFEKIDKYSDFSPDFGIPEYGFPDPTIEAIFDFEQRNGTHIVETIYREDESPPTFVRPYKKSINIALLRSPEGYFVRNLITNLIPPSSYVEYYYRKADGPLFKGWQRFLKYESIRVTWDYAVETGIGGTTREESDLIVRLGYYGQKIDEQSIAGLEANKPFSEIAPGKYRLVINAEDGEHEKWFQTKEEAINLIRKYSPGTRTGRNSWIEDYGAELRIQSIDVGDPLTYEIIFPERRLPRPLDTDEDYVRRNPKKKKPSKQKSFTLKEKLARRKIKAEKIAKESIKIMSPEESKKLTESCPIFHVRMTGIERDGTPFDVIKKIQVPYKETAINMLTVKAMISYGCRVDSAEIVKQEGEEWHPPSELRRNPFYEF